MDEFTRRVQAALGETYRIERELGGGGMSRVFVAEETRVGRKVVVKVLPPEMSAAVNRERFEREIQLAARLQNPHVVPVLTTGGDADLLYYVMPFVEGESLRARLAREGELPVSEAVRILREVADALAEAHRHGIVHRDIKPENIMLRGRHAMVADFGVAKAVAEGGKSHTLTSIGVALGTPAYMSPEQATADPHTDQRADLYALGCVAYEMLAGRPPFDGSTPQALIAAHVTQQPDPVGRYRPQVPPALAAGVMRLLEKRPADRFQTAEEFLQVLDGLSTSGGTTPADTAPYPAEAIARARAHGNPLRVGAFFALGALAVLALVSGLAKEIGLPTWVMPASVALLVVGLPIMIATGLQERRRRVARTTGLYTATPAGLGAFLTWRKALLGGALAFGALALAAGGYMAARVLGIGKAGTLLATGALGARDGMVLADFSNLTTDSTLAASVTGALRVDLSQSPVIRLLDEAAVREALRRMQESDDTELTADRARTVAVREGAKAVIAGEIAPLGSGYVLSARILSANDGSELLSLRETAADAGQIIPALDALSKRLRERVGESLKSLQNTEGLEAVTTASLDALRAYTQGVRLDDVGRAPEAQAKLEEAIAADSTFAMAWRKLSVVAARAGASAEFRRRASTRAFELRDRLTPLERHKTEANYYSNVEGDPERALRAYEAALAVDPTDRTSLNNSALHLVDAERYVEAEAMARRALQVDKSWFSYGHIARALIGQGRHDEADSVVAELAALEPNSPRDEWIGADVAAARRDFERVDSLMLAMTRGRSELGLQAQRLWYDARTRTVRGRLREASAKQDSAAVIRAGFGVPSAELDKVLGVLSARRQFHPDPGDGAATIDSILREVPLESLPAEDRPFYWLASMYAWYGDTAAGRRMYERAEREIPAERKRLMSGRTWARWGLALADSQPQRALAILDEWEQDPEPPCRPCRAAARAHTWDAIGNPDSALAWYRVAVETPTRNQLDADMLDLPIALRRLGELHEARGEREQARRYYQDFVDLWREADPALQPVVRDVRERLARLSAEPGAR